MPKTKGNVAKKTKKKTSVKQKQKVKVIVNVNSKTTRRRGQSRGQSRQSQQPQQIIIQQPSMVSRELPMPMFNPIQQASAPPVFQGVGQMLQPPNELLRNIYREPDFENYNQMPYLQSTLEPRQYEEPAEIQREVESVASSSSIFSPVSSFDEKLQKRFENVMNKRNVVDNFIDVNATNKGFEEPVPQEVALQEAIKGLSFDPLVKAKPKITFSPVSSPVSSPVASPSLSEDGDEIAVVPPVPTSDKKRRGRPKQTPPPLNLGKVENDIYTTIMNANESEIKNTNIFPMKELNNLLAGIGINPTTFKHRYQKENRLLQYKEEQKRDNS